MRHALGLGARSLGRTWPNPAVGCIIVAGDRIVGRGWTQPGGRPHAEAMAVLQAGPAARGATAYVTLEPCAHHGQTPPCAEALIACGIARVVTAIGDPDPRVSGRGHAMLRAAGVEVVEQVLCAEGMAAHGGFLRRLRTGLPQVTLKLAMTLDGRIATAAGASRWITGPEARRAVHAMRARHDAVMIGIGTALGDDPDLTVRDLGMAYQPIRIVIDSALRLPVSGRLAQSAPAVPVWLCHSEGADPGPLAEAGARLILCAAENGRVQLRDALRRLGEAGVTRIFCEGGAELAASLLTQGMVDDLVAITAGRVFGADGKSAIGPVADGGVLGGLPEFSLVDYRRLGGDILHHWRRRDVG